LKTKIVSPFLERFFYKRGYDRDAVSAISVKKVVDAVMAQLDVLVARAALSILATRQLLVNGGSPFAAASALALQDQGRNLSKREHAKTDERHIKGVLNRDE
jgi:hypothetical protein